MRAKTAMFLDLSRASRRSRESLTECWLAMVIRPGADTNRAPRTLVCERQRILPDIRFTANDEALPPLAHRQMLEGPPELAGVLDSTGTALETAGTNHQARRRAFGSQSRRSRRAPEQKRSRHPRLRRLTS